jgi:hypothetical protein
MERHPGDLDSSLQAIPKAWLDVRLTTYRQGFRREQAVTKSTVLCHQHG